jgi:hypothetical protein
MRVVGFRPPILGGFLIPPVHWWYSFLFEQGGQRYCTARLTSENITFEL